MALSVTHTTPADGTFSAAGSAAWDESHTVTGIAVVATSGAYGDLTGTPVLAAVATSGAYGSLSGTPTLSAVATSGAYGDLSGTPSLNIFKQVFVTAQATLVASGTADTLQFIAGTNITLTADAGGKKLTIAAAAGDAAAAWPIGSIYMATVDTNPSTLLGFGTWNSIPGKFLVGVATGNAEFDAGVSGGATGTSYTPSGSNAVVQFTPSGTNAISLFREAVAGTNAASVASGSVSIEYPTGVPVFAGATGSASVSVNWPAGVPTFAGTAHQHGLPISHLASGGAVYFAGAASAWGSGTTLGMNAKVTTLGANASSTNIVSIVSVLGIQLSQTATAAGAITWPASVPQALVTGLVPAGIISWPATAPSAVFKTGTAAAQIFTGVTGSVSGQVFTGVTGTVSGQAFTGNQTSIAILPPYRTVYMWERTA